MRHYMIASVAVLAIALALGAIAARASFTPPVTGEVASAPAGPMAFTTHRNPVLGYQVDLPQTYRRSPLSATYSGDGGVLGHDAYVQRTDVAERELCQREQRQGLLSREREADVHVEVLLDRAVSAVALASSPQRAIRSTSVQPTTIDGREAARVAYDHNGETRLYVIRANGRVYVLGPGLGVQPSSQPKGWLDQVAATFRALTPQAAPEPQRAPRCLE